MGYSKFGRYTSADGKQSSRPQKKVNNRLNLAPMDYVSWHISNNVITTKQTVTSIHREPPFQTIRMVTGIKTREEDSVVQTLSVNTHTSVLFFSTEGLVYRIKAWKIPEGSLISRGKSLFNILPLKNHQSISSIMPYPDENSKTNGMHIIFATSKGKIRKNSLEDFTSINASGKIAMKLDSDDKIIGVKICKDDQDIILSTKLGKCIRFESKKLRIFKGRSSKGIRGINLSESDSIVSLSIRISTNVSIAGLFFFNIEMVSV